MLFDMGHIRAVSRVEAQPGEPLSVVKQGRSWQSGHGQGRPSRGTGGEWAKRLL